MAIGLNAVLVGLSLLIVSNTQKNYYLGNNDSLKYKKSLKTPSVRNKSHNISPYGLTASCYRAE